MWESTDLVNVYGKCYALLGLHRHIGVIYNRDNGNIEMTTDFSIFVYRSWSGLGWKGSQR